MYISLMMLWFDVRKVYKKLYTIEEFTFNINISNINTIERWLTPNQIEILQKKFETKPYLEKGDKQHFAKLLNVNEARIGNWFDNRRKKKRKEGLLCEGDI